MAKIKPMNERERCLVIQNVRRVYWIAGRLRFPRGVQKEDVLQAGLLALCECAVKFDGSKGCKFWTYAQHGVRSAMAKTIRHISEPFSITEYGIEKRRKTLSASTASRKQPNAYPIDYTAEIHDKMTPKELQYDLENEIQERMDVSCILKKIPREDRRLIHQRFGMSGWDTNSFSDIARRDGVSRQATKKRYDRILRVIRRKLRYNEMT